MKKEVKIHIKTDMEARPIAYLVQLASRFNSEIYFETQTVKVNAKSIMGMMSLVIMDGNTLTIDATGSDEQEAIDAIVEFLAGKELSIAGTRSNEGSQGEGYEKEIVVHF